MENPENPDLSAELARWLRYYRDLGFTHLFSSMPQPALAAEMPVSNAMPSASPSEPRAASTSSPPHATITSLAKSSVAALFATTAHRESLEKIREDLGDCQRCKLFQGRKTIVFGSGNPKADIVFVGEGPGADEDEQGLPFVGRAGQLLTDMIEKGLKIPRPDVYICNIVKCRPPQNRKPEKDEIAACRQFVERQIDSIRPRIICALGATAAETLLDVKEAMGRLRGHWHEFRGFPLIVTYHPAYLLRDPSKKAETWADLKMLLARLSSLD